MRKIVRVTLVSLFVLCLLNSYAQKFGHIDANKLITVMPEKEKATAELQTYSKQLEDELMKMQDEAKKKYDEYQAGQDKLSDLIKTTKEKELQDLSTRIQNYSTQANQDIQKKEAELLQPIYEKVRAAIKAVGEEQKLLYVFEVNGLLYYSNDSKDIFDLVRTKLGVTDADMKKSEKKETNVKDTKTLKKGK